jgi:hypothetical protein
VIQPVGIIFNRSSSSFSDREAGDHEAASASPIPEASGGESSPTESASGSTTPAPAAPESAPAKESTAPTKEPSAPAVASPPPSDPPDDGHRPAQRGSRWTAFIR